MSVAVRPYISAGLALASVGVIAAAPLVSQQQSVRLANDQVTLTGTIGTVLTNTVNAILNIPQSELDGVKRLTAAMIVSQNWFIYSPVNVLGADPGHPEMVKGLVDMLIPFPALSRPSGDQLNWWFLANFPMNAGCTGFPPCPNLNSLLNAMFKVPSWAFDSSFGGYTFAAPITPTNNPVSAQDGQWNFDLGQTGLPVPWYAQTVTLDPLEGVKSVLNYLTGTPGTVTVPTVKQIVNTYVDFAKSLWNSWNPFVPQSVLWNPSYSISAYILRPLAKVLCPSCNPYDPFMPVGWKPGGWVPDAFTYVPTSPTNPFTHYPVSHGPVPVAYDFTYKVDLTSASAAAVTAVPQSTGQSDPVAQSPAPLNAVTQTPVRQSAASVRSNRSKVQSPAVTAEASVPADTATATATATGKSPDAASTETAPATAADSSPKASRAGLAKAPTSRLAK